MKWITELPKNVQNEMVSDAIAICEKYDISFDYDAFINEKIVNVIGSSDGELNYEKYAKYLFM